VKLIKGKNKSKLKAEFKRHVERMCGHVDRKEVDHCIAVARGLERNAASLYDKAVAFEDMVRLSRVTLLSTIAVELCKVCKIDGNLDLLSLSLLHVKEARLIVDLV
jgi:hypothetical protein